MNELLEQNFDTVFFDIIKYVSVFIHKSVTFASEQKKVDTDIDIDRDLVLSYAKIRKSALYLINYLCSSKARCQILLEKTQTTAVSAKDPTFTEEANIPGLVVFIINTMYKFDVEGTR